MDKFYDKRKYCGNQQHKKEYRRLATPEEYAECRIKCKQILGSRKMLKPMPRERTKIEDIVISGERREILKQQIASLTTGLSKMDKNLQLTKRLTNDLQMHIKAMNVNIQSAHTRESKVTKAQNNLWNTAKNVTDQSNHDK